MPRIAVLGATAVVLPCMLIVGVADPIEVGNSDTAVQVSSDLAVKLGRSDAPLPGLHAEGGDRHLSSGDNFSYCQLGIDAHAQHRDFSADVDFLATEASTGWVDYFTKREFWFRQASLSWRHEYGSITVGRLKYDLGFGVEGSTDLIPTDGIKLDGNLGGFDLTWIGANVPSGTNRHPHFLQLFGGYPAPAEQDRVGIFRASRRFDTPAASTVVGFTASNPSILSGERYSLDLAATLKDGRVVRSVYQTTPRDMLGRKAGQGGRAAGDSLIAITGDVVKNGRWHVRASWSAADPGYAPALNSRIFPYGASYDELVFDRPLFLGAPIPTDSATAPTVAPDYGLLLDGIELDIRYQVTPSSGLRLRYMRGDNQAGIDLGEVWHLAYNKGIGHGMTAQVSYGYVHADDPFNVGAPSYHMLRFGLSIEDLAGLTSDYLKEKRGNAEPEKAEGGE